MAAAAAACAITMVAMPATGVLIAPAAGAMGFGSAANWQTQPTFSAMIATALSCMPMDWQWPAQICAEFVGIFMFSAPTVATHPANESRLASNAARMVPVIPFLLVMAPP